MKKLLLFLNLILIFNTIDAQTASPPLNMTLHAQWDADTLPTAGSREYNDIWGWVDCEQNEYAIMGSAAYVHFFDVTDIDNIVELGFFAGGEISTWRDMKTYRDRAYAISENTTEGLMIFDLSNIQDTIIKSYHSNAFFNKAHNIFIDNDNGRLYAVGTNTQSQGVMIFDVDTDPDNPILLSSVNLPGGGYVHDIYVRDNIGYCSHGNSGLYIWDFNDPLNPIYIADQTTSGYNHSSWVSEDGNTLIYAEEVPLGLPLGVLDISDLDNGNIDAVTTFKFPLLAPTHQNNVPHNPFIRGDYVIVSHYHDGVQIFDISDPNNPTQVAYYDTHANDSYSGYSGCWGVYPFLPSGTIIASDINEGLHVLTADSIDLEPVSVTTYPEVTITDNTPTPFCSDENGSLEVPVGAENYTWFQDGNIVSTESNIISPMSSGEFYATVSNKHCSLNTETISIEINQSPDLSNFSVDPFIYCENEAGMIIAPSGFDSYTWLENGMIVQQGGESFMIPNTGIFNLMVGFGPCTTTSDGIEVTILDLPPAEIEVLGDPVTVDDSSASFCEDDPISLQVPDTPGATYSWTLNSEAVGGNSNLLEVSLGGSYAVEITGSNGCVISSINFTVVMVEVATSITFENGILSAAAATSYQWFLNGNAIENANSIDFTPQENGLYYCQIENTGGCLATSNSLEVVISNINTIESISDFIITPNPTNGKVNLHLDVSERTELNFKLMHVDGRVLHSFKQTIAGQEVIPIELEPFSAGVYFIQIENKEGLITEKVIKL